MKLLYILFIYSILLFSNNLLAIEREVITGGMIVRNFNLKLSGAGISTPPEHSQFGWATSISDGQAAISAPMEPVNGKETGVVYLYQKVGNEWEFFQKINPREPEHLMRFGAFVKIHSNTLFIGAPGQYAKSGVVYVYELKDGMWEYKQLLRPDFPIWFQKFGTAFDCNDSQAFVTSVSSNEDINTSGIVYVFRKINNLWILKEKIYSPESGVDDFFGAHVSIVADNHVVVSAPRGTGKVEREGAVYSFIKSASGWAMNQKLTHENGMANILFGTSIDYSNGKLVVGCMEAVVDSIHCGDATLYELQDNGLWNVANRFIPEFPKEQDHFGEKVCIENNVVMVGSPKWDKSEEDLDHGTVFIFKNEEAGWTQAGQIIPDDLEANDHLGLSFDMDGDELIVGSSLDDNFSFNCGSAYFYGLNELLTSNVENILSLESELFYNYPNPFSQSTTIYYNLPQTKKVNIAVYDLKGQKVADLIDEVQISGNNQAVWNGKDNSGRHVKSGTYIYHIKTDVFEESGQMIYLK